MNYFSKAVGCALVAVVLTGCTSSDSTSEGTDPDSVSPTTSAVEEPSAEETPAEEVPAPATGAAIKLQGTQVNIPADWQPGSASTLQATGYPKADEGGTFMRLFRFTQVVESLDELARMHSRVSGGKRQDDLTVDGQVVVHVAGRPSRKEHVEIFSTLLAGEEKTLSFDFGNAEPKAERDEIVQSVLATWEFTG